MIMMDPAVRMRTQAIFNAQDASNWGVVSSCCGGEGGNVPLENLLYVVSHRYERKAKVEEKGPQSCVHRW